MFIKESVYYIKYIVRWKPLADQLNQKMSECLKKHVLMKHSPQYEDVRLGKSQFVLQCYQLVQVVDQDQEDNPEAENHEDADEDAEDHEDNAEEHDLKQQQKKADATTPNYYDYATLYPELAILKTNFQVILNEMQHVSTMPWPNWPEQHYETKSTSEWKVFPLVYTFPANVESKRVWIQETCLACPTTTALLKTLPNIRTALFSRLGPHTEIGAHRVRTIK